MPLTATQTTQTASVADVVGETIAAQGVRDAFGVLGSGNLVVTNALVRGGARFHPARHEGGAICMADGYARVTGRVGVCSVHQGPGLTNTMTGLAEAAKSRTPVLVLSGETPGGGADLELPDRSARPGRVGRRDRRARPQSADRRRRCSARLPAGGDRAPPGGADAPDRHPAAACRHRPQPSKPPLPSLQAPAPNPAAIEAAADLLAQARRPAIIAGRGAVLADARDDLEGLGQLTGAILATSAPANGLFAGLPYSLGISGGFASPLAAELLPQADAVLVVGASVNHWTTKHGALIASQAKVAQLDIDARAIGRNQPADVAVLGDARASVRALTAELQRRSHANTGFRSPELAEGIAARRWADEPYDDAGTDEWIDPRTLTIELNKLLPANRLIAVDSGHFTGYPSMYLDVADPRSWLFANGFQAVGLGLGNAIGAAMPPGGAHGRGDRRRRRVPVAGRDRDRGPAEADAARPDLRRHGLRGRGAPLRADGPRRLAGPFPDADLAAIATAAGAKAATVRSTDDLSVVEEWLANPHGPLVLDAKVNPTICAEWLEEAFRAG